MYVNVSPVAFRCLWICLLALQMACFLYYALFARLYARLPTMGLAMHLVSFKLDTMGPYYSVLSATHGIFAVAHGFYVLVALVGSLRARKLCFLTVQQCFARHVAVHPRKKSAASRKQSTQPRLPTASLYERVFGRYGLFGVEGKYFDVLLVLREVLETGLQMQQAYRLSHFAPRKSLNRFYVALLVLNGWATLAIHVVFKDSSMSRRMFLLLCDAALDLMSSVIVPMTLMASYWRDYDPVVTGFPYDKWLNDRWFVNIVNEIPLILVTTWADFAGRFMFAAGLLSCLGNIKRIVRIDPSRQTQKKTRKLIALMPVRPTPSSKRTSLRQLWSTRASKHESPLKRRLDAIVYLVFGLSGTIVLGLHLHAETIASPIECHMQTRPWGSTKPACALVVLDCYQEQIMGTEGEVSSRWSELHIPGVFRLVVRHCPQLAMPQTLQDFTGVNTIKIYNSTVVSWEELAALTGTTHPKLLILIMVRVEFPNGELPVGLLSPNFPRQLVDVKMCVTNLKTLPSDLDTKWGQGTGAGIYLFELSQFDSFPLVITRLRPREVSFANNHITQFPFDAVPLPTLRIFNLGGNPIKSLVPDASSKSKVAVIGASVRFYLVGTSISMLPAWMDGRLKAWLDRTFTRPPVHLAKTSFCSSVSRLLNGTVASFPEDADARGVDKAFVMNATRADAVTWNLQQLCAPQQSFFYPLALEDSWHGLNKPPV
ncbi:hypothetical protein Poli38472_008016 [Pythium oligandrum]|uniref:Uncharacterized protein n=1 Tax=Pythium oligandrum TaxID=41045 RepID=A0A8K1CLQ4_PYTOL|nr:hypothetical protein Poli38472_008016 [Pythium oligandrum]|eukprot:TMW65374.1 hypothetical protein Poli38472_008016 [Pythium oligandrum]